VFCHDKNYSYSSVMFPIVLNGVGIGSTAGKGEREIRGERFTSRIPTCNKMNGHNNKVSKKEREREIYIGHANYLIIKSMRKIHQH
jgi:hypothetical protein